jgi:hypothetical protein
MVLEVQMRCEFTTKTGKAGASYIQVETGYNVAFGEISMNILLWLGGPYNQGVITNRLINRLC